VKLATLSHRFGARLLPRMPAMTVSKHRILVALHLPESPSKLLHAAQAIVNAMTGNAWFPSPTPALALVAAAITQLAAAQAETFTKGVTTFAVRDKMLTDLVKLLHALKAYVQGIADDDPDHAVELIESAAMSVKQTGSYAKPPFVLAPGPMAGSVALKVRSAGDNVGYQWQQSADGGVTWAFEEPSLKAETVIHGLPSGTTVWFRWRPVLAGGPGEWSEPLSILVP
jgi:hypothetical protein